MTDDRPLSGAAGSVGPAGLALSACFAACVLLPPEVFGAGLAAAAILVALASITTAGAAVASPASRWTGAAALASIVAVRLAIAPGEAVEPVVVALVAVLGGLAATGLSARVCATGEGPGVVALVAAAVALVSCRALYETFWGLAASAAQIRASAAAGTSDAILNRLEQGRPYAGFITPAALGGFLAMTLPPVVASSIGKRGAWRAAGLASAALGAGALIATRSITAMAALAGAIALGALRRRITSRIVATVGLVLGLAALGTGLARPDSVFAPFHEGSPWRLRAGNVRIALEIARDHPWRGVGPGGYAEAFPQYRRPADNESHHAHDLPAELVAEWGIPTGVALSLVFFWAFLAPVLRRDAAAGSLSFGLSVGLAAFALHNIADFTAFLPSLLFPACIARGLLAPRSTEVGEARTAARAAWIATAFALALVATGAGLSREAAFDARRSATENDPAQALASAVRAARLAPWDADPPQIAAESRLALKPSDVAGALADAERAVAAAPERPSARWVRARARAAAGDSAGAYADLVEAARLYPLRPEYAAQRDALGEALRQASAQGRR